MSSDLPLKSEIAISADNISKVYEVYDTPVDRLKQLVWPTKRSFAREFPALQDISFTVGRGETIGIIGRNGSGKSTLLQVICGTLQPSSGTMKVDGRIAALLELGAGFNNDFTGRENVYLNASILGMTKEEIDEKYEDIEAFANIGNFIDQPVKTYSSGMYLRLAFATAIHTDPDILIVDEALSVGDEAFQRKCFSRIEDIQSKGGTILFVSHSAHAILQLCTRAILLDSGEKILEGSPKVIVNHYQRLMNLTGDDAIAVREEIKALGVNGMVVEVEEGGQKEGATEQAEKSEQGEVLLEAYDPNLISQSAVVYESQGAVIENPKLLNSLGEQVNILQTGRSYQYNYQVLFTQTVSQVGFGMLMKTVGGVEISGGTTSRSKELRLDQGLAGTRVDVSFNFVCNLNPGTYFMNAGTSGNKGDDRQFLHRILDGIMFQVAHDGETHMTGLVNMQTNPPVVRLIS